MRLSGEETRFARDVVRPESGDVAVLGRVDELEHSALFWPWVVDQVDIRLDACR